MNYNIYKFMKKKKGKPPKKRDKIFLFLIKSLLNITIFTDPPL